MSAHPGENGEDLFCQPSPPAAARGCSLSSIPGEGGPFWIASGKLVERTGYDLAAADCGGYDALDCLICFSARFSILMEKQRTGSFREDEANAEALWRLSRALVFWAALSA